MSEFQREDRYIVIKRKGLHPQDERCIRAALKGRTEPVECVVVESDWPIYEQTWEAVRRLAEGEPQEIEQLQARCAEQEEKAKRFQATALRLDDKHASAMREAKSLAMSLWRQHYREESPNFELCDSVAGIITQIDNMVTGIDEKRVKLESDKSQQQERIAELKSALSSCLKWLGWWSQSYPESPGPGDKQHIDEWKALLSELPTPPTSGGE